jgi:AcrR family transcriptional regulator
MARPKDSKRQALIERTALTLFAERGYHGVSIKDIADAAQISLGSLYTYYPSKNELVNHLFRYWKTKLRDAATAGTETLTGRSAHRKFWENIGDFIQQEHAAFMFLDAQTHAPYLDQDTIDLEHDLTTYAITFYRVILGVSGANTELPLLISASFGAFVQITKAVKAKLFVLDQQMVALLEDRLWKLVNQ